MKGEISENSIVSRGRDQVSCDLGGETAILDMNGGIYYGLNAVGNRIWNLIQEPKRLKEVRDTLLEEFDVEPDRCNQDLLSLLSELLTKGLIEIKDEEAS